MEIPAALIEQIREGKVMLCLGAGASKGATSPDGSEPPLGFELVKLISDKFLGGEDKNKNLSLVSDLAISETDIITFQEFLKDLFIKYIPADYHKLMPTFKWAAIATTNFDLIVERAYEACKDPAQTLVPFYRNSDRVDWKLRSPDTIPYLKLHGCINYWQEKDLPLILTVDQYVTHKKHRDVLFSRVREYASQYPVIIIGQSLEDPDLREMLLYLSDEEYSRPRFYSITPSPSSRQIRFYETKRITCIDGTLKQFIETLNTKLDISLRRLAIDRTQHSLEKYVRVKGAKFSPDTLNFLENDVDYVNSDLKSVTISPKDFYKGLSFGWSPTQQDLDADRVLTDTILSDIILLDEIDRAVISDFYIIKGHAGSGKTVILKRLAFDAATQYECICLYIKSDGRALINPIIELNELIGKRIFLFVDHAVDRIGDLNYFMKTAREKKIPITVLCAERTNEWNVDCMSLDKYVTEYYEMEYLRNKEIVKLIEKLTIHKSLGILENLPKEEQIKAFEKRAGRQLLVALHEATIGPLFEDIIVDEYKKIEPDLARNIYLTICTLNRLGIPVRAGIIKRIHGVSFEQFKERFFLPLEGVVYYESHAPSRDMSYRARHPWIAEVIFERMAPTPSERFDLYIKIVNEIDIGYDSDRKAFRALINARELKRYFPDPIMVRNIYEKAMKLGYKMGYYYQQQGIYEMKRDNPGYSKAYEYLQLARQCAPYDKSIIHSIAELEYMRALEAKSEIERNRHLSSASSLAKTLTGRDSENSYGYHTLYKIEFEKLDSLLKSDPINDDLIAESLKRSEKIIAEGMQRFPDDEFLLEAESRFARMIKDDARAIAALERAVRINPLSPFLAKGLSRLYELKLHLVEARKTLETCLDGQPGDKGLNASFGIILMKYFPEENNKIEYYLRRSFTDGDTNYRNKFLYARQLYTNNKQIEAKREFENLNNAPISPEIKSKIRGKLIDDKGAPIQSNGVVCHLEATYGFITREGYQDTVFIHKNNVEQGIWNLLHYNAPISYNIGFTYRGPTAFNVETRNP